LSPSPVSVCTSATRHASRGSSGAFQCPAGSNGPGWTNPDHAALSARVQSVLNKIDTFLMTAGKISSLRPQQFAGGSASAEFSDLLDRLAQLDMLLDDLVAMGRPRLAHAVDVVDHAVDANGASVRDVAWSPLERSRRQQVGTPGVPAPFMVMRQRSVGNDSVRSATPRLPSSGCLQRRFVEVPRPQAASGGSGAPPVGRGLVPPLGLQKPLGIHTPGMHSPVPTGMGSPSVPPPFIQLSATTGGSDGWRNAPLPPNKGWQVGGRPPVSGASTPRVGGSLPAPFGVPVHLGGHGDGRLSPTTSTPARAFSVPRGIASMLGSPNGLGLPNLGLLGVPGIPQSPSPPRLWMPSLPPSLNDAPASSAEGTIREWLKNIPIGNGADRGWDDSQIREIATFAQEKQLEHASAEEIYKRYVEYQVEKAEAADT